MDSSIAQIDFNTLQNVASPSFSGETRLTNLLSGPLGIINLAFFGAGVLLLLYLIWGGMSFMLSGGEPKKVEGARSTITNALLGFFIVIFAFFVVQIVGLVLGLEGITQIF